MSANGDLSILSRCRRERFYFIGALLLVGGMASVWPTTGDELALSSPFFQIPVFLRVGVGLFLAAMAFYYAARARKAHIWVVLWFVLWPLGEVSSYLWVFVQEVGQDVPGISAFQALFIAWGHFLPSILGFMCANDPGSVRMRRVD